MHETAFNPALIRVVLIALFLLVTQILRARKGANLPKPAVGTVKPSPLTLIREAMQQAGGQPPAAQSGQSVNQTPFQISKPFQFSGQFQQPPTMQNIPPAQYRFSGTQQPPSIEPESSFIPSLLLLALLGCLVLMAYRYLAG